MYLEECPYNCVEGKIFDTSIKAMVTCPHCGERLKNIVKGKEKDESGRTINEILALPRGYMPSDYEFTRTIPDGDKITPNSLSLVNKLLTRLMDDIVLGVLPSTAFYINLGVNSDILNFVYSFLIKAFRFGFTVAPLVSTTDIVSLRGMAEGLENSSSARVRDVLGVTYADLEMCDVCVVTIDAGVTQGGVYAVKGLVEGRSRKGLATLVFTNAVLNNFQRTLIVSPSPTKGVLHLLYPVEVEYKKDSFSTKVVLEESVAKEEAQVMSGVPEVKPIPSSEITQEDLLKLLNPSIGNIV